MKSVTIDQQESRKKTTIANLYRYSDLSICAIAQQVDLDERQVQRVVDELVNNEVLEFVVDQSTTSAK